MISFNVGTMSYQDTNPVDSKCDIKSVCVLVDMIDIKDVFKRIKLGYLKNHLTA